MEEDLKAFLWDGDKFEAEKEAKKAFDIANEPPEDDEDEEVDFEVGVCSWKFVSSLKLWLLVL